jgi:formylglycine-generating enzyme required for sulfatase activity
MKSPTMRLFGFVTVLTILMTACAPKAIPQPPATELPATEPPSVTEPPVATEPATLVPTATETTVVEATPTLQVIDLAGPLMEVGSTWQYVDGSTLVAVPAGEFIMGHGNPDNPEHKVTLSEFWIYRNEVANKQYALCVALGKCSPPDPQANPAFGNPLRVNEPVIGVNWDQAQAYCKFVNGRLPTEAEWEKTARGPEGNIYPWGDATPGCDLANIGRCKPGVTPVTEYPQGASFYGATNMAGNVFEWVADWYSPNYYGQSPAENPLGPELGTFRSVRSSSFESDSYLAESARRFREKPIEQRPDLGFRCVVEDPAAMAPWCQMVAIVNPDQSGSGPSGVSLPSPSCPSVGVSTFGFCNSTPNGKIPAATVNFNPDALPAGTLITYPGGCSLDSTTADPNDYYCTGGGSASIQALCTVPPPPVPAGCEPGYTLNGNTCEYTGGLPGEQCLPGVNYDPATQCCGATTGVTDSYTLCPAAAPYYAGGVCQPWPVADYEAPVIVTVSLGTCSTGGTNDGCPQPPAGVSCKPYSGDPKNCCCTNADGNCQ